MCWACLRALRDPKHSQQGSLPSPSSQNPFQTYSNCSPNLHHNLQVELGHLLLQERLSELGLPPEHPLCHIFWSPLHRAEPVAHSLWHRKSTSCTQPRESWPKLGQNIHSKLSFRMAPGSDCVQMETCGYQGPITYANKRKYYDLSGTDCEFVKRKLVCCPKFKEDFKHILSQLTRPFWHPQQVWYRDKKGLFSHWRRRTSPHTTCALHNTFALISKNMQRTLKQFLKTRRQQFVFIFSYKNSISKHLATAYEKNTWKICKK